MKITFWITSRQRLIAINVNEKHLIQLCQRIVVRIRTTGQEACRVHELLFLYLPKRRYLAYSQGDHSPSFNSESGKCASGRNAQAVNSQKCPLNLSTA